MAETDVRGVLQYVPLFRGRVFAIFFEQGLLPEAAVAESLLDVLALQKIGVKLVLGTLGGDVEVLSDRAIEMELKAAKVLDDMDAQRAREILDRGQAVIVDAGSVSPLDASVVSFCRGIGAEKFIALCNGDLVSLDGQALVAVAADEAAEWSQLPGLKGGDFLQQAAAACRQGIPRVHLLDGKRQGVLVDELFSNEGVGTMVYSDSYRDIRELREEDIPELLAMIGRTVRATWLVPRNYEDIRSRIEDFHVMTIDGNVVGCVALHRYDDSGRAELACLYVKRTHESAGYGRELVEHVVRRAKSEGLTTLFALTTSAARFFRESLGWTEVDAGKLPPSRYAQWKDSARGSLVFEKDVS